MKLLFGFKTKNERQETLIPNTSPNDSDFKIFICILNTEPLAKTRQTDPIKAYKKDVDIK